MAKPIDIRVRITRFEYAGSVLFNDFALTVPAGQSLAILGASGVGKTTLLRMIAGDQTGAGVEVTVGGILAVASPAAGYLFQDARLLPWLSAAENIRLVAPNLTHADIADLLAKVGLQGQGGTYPAALSAGMQQRVGLARALAVQSGLTLLDEPFAALDPDTARQMRETLASLTRGKTRIIVTHDPLDAAMLADRVVMLTGRPARIGADFVLDQSGGGDLTDRLDQVAGAWARLGVTA